MSIGNKINALISILLSLAFLALALLGLYGVVWARGEALGYIGGVAAVADRALGRAHTELTQGGAELRGLGEGTIQLAAGIAGAGERIQENAGGRAAARVVDFDRLLGPIAAPLHDIGARLAAWGDRMARAGEDAAGARAALPAAQGRINAGVTVVAGLLALLFFLKGISRMADFLRALARLIGLDLRGSQPVLPAAVPPPAATPPPAIATASPVVVVAPRIVVQLPQQQAPAPRFAAPPKHVAVAELPPPELPERELPAPAPGSLWERRWGAQRVQTTQPLPVERPARPLRELPPVEPPGEEPPGRGAAPPPAPFRLAADDPRRTRRLPETEEMN